MLFRNTAWQSAPLISSYVFSVILAPLMLSRLGLAAFGVWAVTGALALWASLLDLGISRSLARFVALYHAQGDRRGIQECAGLGLIVITGIGAVGALAAYVAAPFMADQLEVLGTGDMRIVLYCSLTIFLVNAYDAVLNAVPVGLQNMKPPNTASLTGYFVNFSFSVGALIASTDLVVYAQANAAAAIVALLVHIVMFVRVWPGPRIAIPSWARAKEILSFSLKTQVAWISDLVNFSTDGIIVALLVGPRAAGAYEIATRVVSAVRSVGVLATSAMVPLATDQIARHGRAVIAGFYREYTKKSLAVALPIFGVAAVSAPFLLEAWLGEPPPDSIAILTVLVGAYFVNIATNVPMIIVTSDGKPGLQAWTSALTAAVNAVLTLVLASLFGLWGVLAGTFVALSSGSALFIVLFHRQYDLGVKDLRAAAGGPVGLALGLAIPFAVYYAVVTPDVEGRLPAAVALAITAGLYAGMYWVAASRLGYLPAKLTLPGRFAGPRGRGPQSAESSPAGTGRT